jgi:hypothetical protein
MDIALQCTNQLRIIHIIGKHIPHPSQEKNSSVQFIFVMTGRVTDVVCGGYLWLWEDLIKGRPLLRFSGILGCSLNFIYAAACDFSRVPVFS